MDAQSAVVDREEDVRPTYVCLKKIRFTFRDLAPRIDDALSCSRGFARSRSTSLALTLPEKCRM
jgi:hypothetical protein